MQRVNPLLSWVQQVCVWRCFSLNRKRVDLGLGRRLLTYGIEELGIRELCVNEQNPLAKGFYEHMGFECFKWTELDEQGNPYPLLYMRLTALNAKTT